MIVVIFGEICGSFDYRFVGLIGGSVLGGMVVGFLVTRRGSFF